MKAKRLEELEVSGSRMSGTLPPELGLIAGFEQLSLRESAFSGSIPVRRSASPRPCAPLALMAWLVDIYMCMYMCLGAVAALC